MPSYAFTLLLLSSSVLVVSGFTMRPQSYPVKYASPSKLELMPFPDLALSQETIETSKHVFHVYGDALAQYPVTTKAITSGILATVGDAIAQVSSHNGYDGKPFSYDYSRGLCFLGFGAVYTGVFQHYWFDFLGSHICQWGEALKLWGPSRAAIPVEDVYDLNEWWTYFDVVSVLESTPSNTAVATAKLAANQFLMIPSVYMPLFFAVTGSLAKLDLEENMERTKNMYIPLLKRNYLYWLPIQFFQFLIVPANFQILFISVASLLWTVILSSIVTDQPPASTGEVATTDTVTYEDVEEALIPQSAREFLEDPKFGSTTVGGALGLMASAADDGLLGGFVSNLFGATIGSGVAVMAATGAVVGLMTATTNEQNGVELPEDRMMRQANTTAPFEQLPE
jgi:hypothetical protein